jgi:hypothetical protein
MGIPRSFFPVLFDALLNLFVGDGENAFHRLLESLPRLGTLDHFR